MSRLWRASPLTYLALVVAAGLSVFPIWWMFVVASRTNDAMGQLPPPITPGGNLGANISRLFDNTDAYFLTGLINSTVVATTVTVSVVFFSSLAGFAFAKLRFRGRNALLLVIIATMMVPTQLGVIPLYMLMSKLQWNDRLPAVIVPVLVTGFGVFMMRQYAGQAISDELIEAARMDGCGTARIWWHVVVPALRPAAAVLGLLTFMTTWNDFLWPYAVLNDPANPTVQLSLRALSDGYYQDMSQVFTGTAIATLPLLLVFVLFGRQIIGGIMEGAVKA
ncbi:carbohydrate ABC transporter permease [Micromonospora profundi]|uniref:Carbohydrate ABC transporter permease n=1 Tax=Micromonospora profundi TaxID=1420889 RepID=A0AAJ6HYL0_9ACTN|nr:MULTISPECIES: carbohydrate ABC transporter permease [Micromonospora]KOX09395.1 sugar ABC transporter permease [Micromonospora sp. NRRL B-16802]WLS47448.1 carbohydrate ABC transporter permease [Micromonospora profundi]